MKAIKVHQYCSVLQKRLEVMKLLLFVALAVSWIAGSVSSSSFHYSNQYAWGPSDIHGSVCTTGRQQSPINIRTDAVIKNSITRNLKFEEWNTMRNGLFINNGHTLKFTPDGAKQPAFTTTHKGKYQVMGMHMHWGENDGVGSEHRINGEQASLEIHFVHRNLDVPDTARNAYAVVAVMAEAGSEAGTLDFSPGTHWRSSLIFNRVETLI